ncbi:helix-turn-helix domain-containing protein [Novosphingobium resinovorum]
MCYTHRDCASGDGAHALNIHHRTLRRRLKDEGTTFQDVKDDLHRDLSLYYLRKTRLDFRGISEKLAFAEKAVFSRSCRRWSGQSPSQLRAAPKSATARGTLS